MLETVRLEQCQHMRFTIINTLRYNAQKKHLLRCRHTCYKSNMSHGDVDKHTQATMIWIINTLTKQTTQTKYWNWYKTQVTYLVHVHLVQGVWMKDVLLSIYSGTDGVWMGERFWAFRAVILSISEGCGWVKGFEHFKGGGWFWAFLRAMDAGRCWAILSNAEG
jgi:hypothetical protein